MNSLQIALFSEMGDSVRVELIDSYILVNIHYALALED